MKKIFFIITIFLTLLGGRVAAQVTEIKLAMPADSVGVPGDIVRMPVILNTDVTGENIISFRLELSYYSSIRPVGVSKAGTLIDSWGEPSVNFENGRVIVSAAGTNPIADTTGVLFYVDFELLTVNSTAYISLYTSTDANNYFNEGNYTFNFTSGRIQINEPPRLNVYISPSTLSKGDSVQVSVSGGTSPYNLFVSDTSVAVITSGNYLKGVGEGKVTVTAYDVNEISGTSWDVQVYAIKLYFPTINGVTPGDTILIPILINDLSGLDVISGNFSFAWDKGEVLELVKTNTLLQNASVESMRVSTSKINYSFATSTAISGSDTLALIKLATSLDHNGQTIYLTLNDIVFNESYTGNYSYGYLGLATLTNVTISGSFPQGLKPGDQVQMSYAGGTPPYIWSSSNIDVATIDSTGLVNIIKGGDFLISLTDVNNQVAQTSTVKAYDGIFTITNGATPAGSTYDLPVTVTAMPDGRGYSAFSMDISYDSSRLDFVNVVNTGSLSEQFSFSVNNMGNVLKIAAASQNQITVAGNLFFLQFNVRSTNTTTTYLYASNVIFNEGTPNLYAVNGSITPGNAFPVAGDTTLVMDEDSIYTFAAGDFPYHQDQGIAFSRIQIESLPSTGSLTYYGSPVYVGQQIDVSAIANFKYTPVADTNGIALTNFTVKVGNAESFSSNTGIITMDINPVNDYPFFTLSGDITIGKNFSTPQVVTVTASPVPADEVNQKVYYSVDPLTVSFANISVNDSTGEVTITSVKDSIGIQQFNLIANDSQTVNNTYSQIFTLTITNNAPIVLDQSFNVNENSIAGTVVDTVAATDADNDLLYFSILSGNTGNAFIINDSTGVISVDTAALLDFETTPSYTLVVQVSDISSSATVNIFIQINDLAENSAPVVLDQSFNVNENYVGEVGAVVASDSDNDPLYFSVLSGNTGNVFVINDTTGVISVDSAAVLDFETTPSYTLVVHVSDATASDTANIFIQVNDLIENNSPVISDQSFSVNENSSVGTVVGTVVASDPDNDALTFSITSSSPGNAFSINSADGSLVVVDSSLLDFEVNPLFTLTVKVSDNLDTASAIITITVNDLPDDNLLKMDSVALVALYNSAGGAGWTRKTNWLTAPLAAGWEGITVTNDRVTAINLAGNNLTGAIPFDITNLSALGSLDLSNNQIQELPDLSGISTLTSINVAANKLTFEDLESNAQLTGITYSPQDSIGDGGYFLMPANQDTTLSVSVGGTANQYQWNFKGGNVGIDTNIHYIASIDRASSGAYQVQVTNAKVPSLTLYSGKATIMAGAIIAGNVLDETGVSLNGNAEVKLLEVKAAGGYDTTSVVNISANGSYSFGRVLLSDYIIVAVADTNFHSKSIPTYYPGQMEWETATPVTLNEDFLAANISVIKVIEVSLGGTGQISGTIYEEVTGGRVTARKRVQSAGVSVRRARRTGRGNGALSDLELVGYTQSDSEGKFIFKELSDDIYYLNIQYPGYPMNPNSFVEIPVGNVGGRTSAHNNQIEVEALVANNLITVTQIFIVTDVKEDALYADIKAYPNPTSGVIYLDLRAYAKEFHVSLHDSMGRIIWEKNDASGLTSISMSEFQQGIYFLKIQDGDRIASSMKILLK